MHSLVVLCLLAAVTVAENVHDVRKTNSRAAHKRCWICHGDGEKGDDQGDNSVEDQFDRRSSYQWGYYVDQTRYHKERRDNKGYVGGEVAYVDANGNQVKWDYKATPEGGFKVTNYQTGPENAHALENFVVPRFRLDESPLLKRAFDRKKIYPAGFDGNQARFAIDPSALTGSGSLSELARDLNVKPIAAVHDGRGPPSKMNARDQTAPLLLRHDPVPGQHGRNFFILMPVQ